MRRAFTLLAAAVLAASTAYAAVTLTREVLVQTSPTKIPRNGSYAGFELQNNGPNDIYCAIGANSSDAGPPVYPDGGLSVQVGMCRDIAASGGAWSGSVPAVEQIWCVAKTANQASGAATVLTEVP